MGRREDDDFIKRLAHVTRQGIEGRDFFNDVTEEFDANARFFVHRMHFDSVTF
ncbi:unannotated protein [freshwater metagenome]|uniref:Unannotated protein n=1 Tax=freshwater metagenome TaxID=449393 RepID=A0A6J6ZR92_9ZZZZ